MRIPKSIPLAVYIKQLIKEDKIVKFYLSDDWKELKNKVLQFFHYECQDCLANGRYTKADCVHHHNEVRIRPDLALSRYYVDDKGQKQYNLIPLCNSCHNKRHEKLLKYQYKDKFTNEERW